MIIEKVILQNFGIYGGRHVFDLAPESPLKPIVLFGGLNGAGKTTFLDAIQLALYGKQAHCSNRGSLAYDTFLRDAINRMADPAEGSSIEIHFRRTSEGKESHFAVIRSWRETGKGIRERVEAFQNGEPSTVLSEGWSEYIEAYLPNRISDLFFFDGEQIKELAESTNAAAMLKSAIHSLLGLDIVDRLTADLVVIERRKRLAAKNDKARKNLHALHDECVQLEKLHESAIYECAEAQNAVDRLNKRLGEIECRFRHEGGELYDRRDKLDQERITLQAEIREIEERLIELASGSLPLCLVENQLHLIEQQISKEVSVAENQLLQTLLIQRDRQTLALLTRKGCNKAISSALAEFLASDRNNRKSVPTEAPFLHADEHILESLRSLHRTSLPSLIKEARSKAARLTDLHHKFDTVDRQLAQVPQTEAIARVTKELHDTRETLREAIARKEMHESKKAQVERDLTTARNAYSRDLESNAHLQIQQDENARILHYSARVRETLTRFRCAAVARRIQQLERLILESYEQLIRKSNFLSSIRIDPEDFSVTLFTTDGAPIQIARLSAGERQLLATSMLWGLARASGRTVPTIIDTPLGRLDSTHRGHLVERYFPVASHQVILLSTDEEIDECHLEQLKPFITRSYRLEYDSMKRTTTPQEGYFWK